MTDSFSSSDRDTGPEIVSVDSLSRAIREVREELLSWIDTELSRLRELPRNEDRSMWTMSDLPASPWSSSRDAGRRLPPNVRDGDGPGTPDGRSGMEKGTTRRRGWPDDRDSHAAFEEPPMPVRGPGMELEPPSTPVDPAERLDALARRLDHRLKQAGGAPKGPPATTAGGGKEMRDEARETSTSRVAGWPPRGDSPAEGAR